MLQHKIKDSTRIIAVPVTEKRTQYLTKAIHRSNNNCITNSYLFVWERKGCQAEWFKWQTCTGNDVRHLLSTAHWNQRDPRTLMVVLSIWDYINSYRYIICIKYTAPVYKIQQFKQSNKDNIYCVCFDFSQNMLHISCMLIHGCFMLEIMANLQSA